MICTTCGAETADRDKHRAPHEGASSRPDFSRGTPDRARAERAAAAMSHFAPRRTALLRALALVDKINAMNGREAR